MSTCGSNFPTRLSSSRSYLFTIISDRLRSLKVKMVLPMGAQIPRSRRSWGIEPCTVRQDCPNCASQFVCQRCDDDTVWPPLEQGFKPRRVPTPRYDRTSPMHEQGAQINIAALAYPMLSNASACSSLSRYQPEPRCEFTARFESGRVADRRDRGSRGEQADAGDLDQSLALLGPAQGAGQSTFDHCHFPIQGLNTCPLFSQTHNQHFWQSFGCLCQSTGPRLRQRGIPGRQHDAELIQNAAQCIRWRKRWATAIR